MWKDSITKKIKRSEKNLLCVRDDFQKRLKFILDQYFIILFIEED